MHDRTVARPVTAQAGLFGRPPPSEGRRTGAGLYESMGVHAPAVKHMVNQIRLLSERCEMSLLYYMSIMSLIVPFPSRTACGARASIPKRHAGGGVRRDGRGLQPPRDSS